MARRGELPYGAWARTGPPLPGYGRRGGRWRGQRPVVGGAYRASREPGCPGGTCRRCIPWQACYDRFVRWRRRDGTWDRLPAHARTRTRGPKRGAIGEAEWSASVDTTVGRAHRPSETQKGGPDPAERGPGARTGRLLDQAAPLLRRAGAPPFAGAHGRPAQREHAACGAVGGPPGRRAGHRPHPPRTRRPARAPGEVRRQAARLRGGALPQARRGGGAGQQAQAVAVATRYEKRAANYGEVVVAASPVLWMAS